jgi:hypothetical protein
LKGINHYRLKQTDADGHFRYYPVRSIRFNTPELLITFYPNPVKNILTVNVNGQKITGTLSFIDGNGKVVLQTNINTSDKVKINVSKLPAGMYMYRLNDLKGTFIKQ